MRFEADGIHLRVKTSELPQRGPVPVYLAGYFRVNREASPVDDVWRWEVGDFGREQPGRAGLIGVLDAVHGEAYGCFNVSPPGLDPPGLRASIDREANLITAFYPSKCLTRSHEGVAGPMWVEASTAWDAALPYQLIENLQFTRRLYPGDCAVLRS